MAVLLFDKAKLLQGRQACQRLAGVLRALRRKDRLQIRRNDLPGADAPIERDGVGPLRQQSGCTVGGQIAAGAERLEPGGLFAGRVAQIGRADGFQVCGDHRPAAAVKDGNFQRSFDLAADRIRERLRCYAENRGEQRVVTLAQPHAGVASLGAHGPQTIHKGVLHQQHRGRVFPAKGGQAGQFLHIGQAQLRQRNSGIQPQADRPGLGGVVGGPGVDGLTEGG